MEVNACIARNGEVRPGACYVQGHLWQLKLGYPGTHESLTQNKNANEKFKTLVWQWGKNSNPNTFSSELSIWSLIQYNIEEENTADIAWKRHQFIFVYNIYYHLHGISKKKRLLSSFNNV